MKIEIDVPKEKFKEIKDMKNYDFNTYLRYRLRGLILDLDNVSEEALERKIKETKERMAKMVEEKEELKEFYEKAKRDKENMEKWIYMLDEENEKLLEMMKNGRTND